MTGHKPFAPARPNRRPLRFAERVKEELAELLPSGVKDSRLEGISLLTITSVTLTPNLKHGTVLFALMGEESRIAEVEAGLNESAPIIRKELMRRLRSKITPHLVFKYDRGLDNVARVDELLKRLF